MIFLLADIILIIHFGLVIFVTSFFFLVPLGWKYKWKWLQNRRLRLIHLGLMLVITTETIFGIACPLTTIENFFRGVYISNSFLTTWLYKIIFWDLPSQFFLGLYILCFGWTLIMWRIFPFKN